MGRSRENRLRIRRLIVPAAAGFCVGAVTPPGVFAGDAGRVLVTFLGLISASILPTISLLVGNMTASGRSVKALGELRDELGLAIDTLFELFGLVAVAVLTLMLLSLPSPLLFLVDQLPRAYGNLIEQVPPRFGQGLLLSCVFVVVRRSGSIPAVIRKSLEIRAEIAAEEARRKTAENAPKPSEVASAFKTKPGFGRIRPLEEAIGRSTDKQLGDS